MRLPNGSLAIRTAHPHLGHCALAFPPRRRQGFQNLVVTVFFPILDPATGGQVPDGARGCTPPVTSTTSGAAMGIEHVQVSVR